MPSRQEGYYMDFQFKALKSYYFYNLCATLEFTTLIVRDFVWQVERRGSRPRRSALVVEQMVAGALSDDMCRGYGEHDVFESITSQRRFALANSTSAAARFSSLLSDSFDSHSRCARQRRAIDEYTILVWVRASRIGLHCESQNRSSAGSLKRGVALFARRRLGQSERWKYEDAHEIRSGYCLNGGRVEAEIRRRLTIAASVLNQSGSERPLSQKARLRINGSGVGFTYQVSLSRDQDQGVECNNHSCGLYGLYGVYEKSRELMRNSCRDSANLGETRHTSYLDNAFYPKLIADVSPLRSNLYIFSQDLSQIGGSTQRSFPSSLVSSAPLQTLTKSFSQPEACSISLADMRPLYWEESETLSAICTLMSLALTFIVAYLQIFSSHRRRELLGSTGDVVDVVRCSMCRAHMSETPIWAGVETIMCDMCHLRVLRLMRDTSVIIELFVSFSLLRETEAQSSRKRYYRVALLGVHTAVLHIRALIDHRRRGGRDTDTLSDGSEHYQSLQSIGVRQGETTVTIEQLSCGFSGETGGVGGLSIGIWQLEGRIRHHSVDISGYLTYILISTKTDSGRGRSRLRGDSSTGATNNGVCSLWTRDSWHITHASVRSRLRRRTPSCIGFETITSCRLGNSGLLRGHGSTRVRKEHSCTERTQHRVNSIACRCWNDYSGRDNETAHDILEALETKGVGVDEGVIGLLSTIVLILDED
ncbi:hypothetical protein Tco_1182050 [Tanacetum coccineum]